MTNYDNRNSGALFKNENKMGNQPDYSGPFTGPNNEEMQIAAWLKDGKRGKFMSVSISPKFQPQQAAPQAQAAPPPPLDDDIPFS